LSELGANAFGNLHENLSKINATETAIKQLIHHFTRVSNAWKDVLPQHIYLQSIGYLLDGVYKKMIDLLLYVKDISAKESKHIAEIFQHLIKCEKVFEAPQKEDNNIADLNNYIANRDKYHKVAEILDLPLRKIGENYNNKYYSKFSPRELHHFITALFSESPLILKIKNNGR